MVLWQTFYFSKIKRIVQKLREINESLAGLGNWGAALISGFTELVLCSGNPASVFSVASVISVPSFRDVKRIGVVTAIATRSSASVV